MDFESGWNHKKYFKLCKVYPFKAWVVGLNTYDELSDVREEQMNNK